MAYGKETEDAVLELKDVSVSYGSKAVVHGVSLSVGRQETVSIVGESGSGKTTLLKAVLGFLGDEGQLTEGEVRFGGAALPSLEADEMRKLRGSRIGMVYQQAGRSMDPITKIGAQFYEAIRTKENIDRKESDRRAIDCMKQLSLKEPEKILRSYPAMLSGGTNQRVALALAMVMNPKLLLADEPTSALDVTVQVEVLKAMKALKESSHAALLMVTHNMGVVAQLSDKVGVMYNGYLVEWGSSEQVLNRPGHPYTRMLMDSVLRMDGTLPEMKTVYHMQAKGGCPYYHRCPEAKEVCEGKCPEMRAAGHGRRLMCHRVEIEETNG